MSGQALSRHCTRITVLDTKDGEAFTACVQRVKAHSTYVIALRMVTLRSASSKAAGFKKLSTQTLSGLAIILSTEPYILLIF